MSKTYRLYTHNIKLTAAGKHWIRKLLRTQKGSVTIKSEFNTAVISQMLEDGADFSDTLRLAGFACEYLISKMIELWVLKNGTNYISRQNIYLNGTTSYSDNIRPWVKKFPSPYHTISQSGVAFNLKTKNIKNIKAKTIYALLDEGFAQVEIINFVREVVVAYVYGTYIAWGREFISIFNALRM